MTIKQIVTILGGLVIGVLVTLAMLAFFHISIESYGPIYATATVILFGLAGSIGLDSLFKAGFLSK